VFLRDNTPVGPTPIPPGHRRLLSPRHAVPRSAARGGAGWGGGKVRRANLAALNRGGRANKTSGSKFLPPAESSISPERLLPRGLTSDLDAVDFGSRTFMCAIDRP